jgi:hypothetical protein
MKIDGVEYKFKRGVSNTMNKRFVGYIAQQIESVVPQAVSLIDGILHVDYESLIPYLSESIKQNFKDINDLNSKTDHIHQVVDMMYTEYLRKEQKKKANGTHAQSSNYSADDRPMEFFVVEDKRRSNDKWNWIIAGSIVGVLLLSFTVSMLVWQALSENNRPSSSAATDRDVLIELFNTTNGIYWENSKKWLSATSICEWYQVTCNSNARVTKLVLSQNNITGTLPPSIAKLEYLQELTIRYTGISGEFPVVVFSLPLLETLTVRGTPFSSWEIPSSISSAKSLTELSLNDCGLIGPIPREVTTHQSLLKLDVANNHIDGTLPSFANSQIEMLRFENTQLSGSIPLLPDSLLQQLILRENDLSGGLSRVSTLTRLMILDLANNNLRGDLELSDEALDMLTLFDVSNNYLVAVPAKLSSVDNYLSCNISGNELHCPIDQWLVTHCYGTCK